MKLIWKYSLMFALVGIAIFGLSQMSDGAEGADIVWDGGGADNLASTKENWVGDVVPAYPDSIIFDSTSSKNCVMYNMAFTNFNMSTGYTGNIYVNISIDVSSYNINSGTLWINADSTGHSFWQNGGVVYGKNKLTLGGNFVITSGINERLNLTLSGGGNLKTGTQTIESLTISGSGTITQTGDIRIGAGGYSQTGGTFTPHNDYWTYCSGNFSAGTIDNDKLRLNLTGINKQFSGSGVVYPLNLTISGQITLNVGGSFVADAFCNYGRFTITTGEFFIRGLSYGYAYHNSGVVGGAGDGYVKLSIYSANISEALGDYEIPLTVFCHGANSESRTVTLLDSPNLDVFNIVSEHASYTLTFNLNGKTITCDSMDIKVRAILTGAGTIDGDLLLTDGAITQTGDLTITGDYEQTGGTLTGSTSYWITCAGDFTVSSGTFSTCSLNMTGASKILTCRAGEAFQSIAIYGTITLSSGGGGASVGLSTQIGVGNTLTITTGNRLQSKIYSGNSFNNYGTIAGDGTLEFLMYNADRTDNPGVVSSNFALNLHSASGAGRTWTIPSNLAISKSMSISSESATYSVTLNLNGKTLTCSSLTVGTRGILTGAGTITCSGLFDAANGTFTPETSTLELTGTGNLRLGSNSVNNLIISGDTTIYQETLAEQLSINGNYNQGAYRTIIDGKSNGLGLWINGTFDGELCLYDDATDWTVYWTAPNWGGWVNASGNIRCQYSSLVYLDILKDQAGMVQLGSWTGTDNFTWNATSWTEQTMIFSLSRVTGNDYHDLYVDGIYHSSEQANQAGALSFTFSGPWSNHEFLMVSSSFIPSEPGYWDTDTGKIVMWLLVWGTLTIFNLLGFWIRIPLIQMAAFLFALTGLYFVPWDTVPVLPLALVIINLIIFALGLIESRR